MTYPPAVSRQWVIHRTPGNGEAVTPDLFVQREHALRELAEGEALVRVELLNVHSSTRMRIRTGLVPPGSTDPTNYACARVMRSRHHALAEGALIACQSGWQEWQVIRPDDPPLNYAPPSDAVRRLNGTGSQWCYAFRPHLTESWGADVLMDVFGTSGMTAFFGVRHGGPVLPGSTVLVAGITGGVGSLIAQLLRDAGARVVGLAGGASACRWAVETLGIAICLDHRDPNLAGHLGLACPNGVTFFSDGVGGTLTSLGVALLLPGGCLFAFGAAAAFADERPGGSSGETTLREALGISADVEASLVARGARGEAWIVDRFYEHRLEAEDRLDALMREGRLIPVNSVADGFDALPAAVSNRLDGPRRGKLQVRFTH